MWVGIVQVPFKSLSDALDATKRGEVWGVVHFGQNFTDELVVRQSDGNYADNETIIASRISITLDWSSEYYDNYLLFRRISQHFLVWHVLIFFFPFGLHNRPADFADSATAPHRSL